MEKTVKRDLVIGVLVTIAYAIAGTMFGESVSNVMSYVLIMTLFGLSFNLQFGYAGMTSLGHAMYFGTGGYVLVALCQKAHMNVWLACLLTLVICFVFYTLCGIVCLKNNMMTFTFLSMGISLSVSVAVSKWMFMGGTVGLNCKVAPAWMNDYKVLYLFILAVVVVCTILIYMLSKSPFVMLLKGGRENEERLVFLGVNTHTLHTVVFVISGRRYAVCLPQQWCLCGIPGFRPVVRGYHHVRGGRCQQLLWPRVGRPDRGTGLQLPAPGHRVLPGLPRILCSADRLLHA